MYYSSRTPARRLAELLQIVYRKHIVCAYHGGSAEPAMNDLTLSALARVHALVLAANHSSVPCYVRRLGHNIIFMGALYPNLIVEFGDGTDTG